MKKTSILLTFVCLLFSSAPLFAQSGYKIAGKIHLEGEGGWDYLTVDEVNNRIFVSHATIAQVVDLKTGTLAGTIPDTKGIHGIALANELNKGFTSNGRDSSVTVFNLKTLEVLTKIKINGKNPDAILYDPFSKRVFTFNGGSSNSTVIDAKENKVIGNIALDGKPEFSQTDGKGQIFVNIEDKNKISVINSVTMSVEKNWSIAPGDEPSGLALDNENHRLFSVCSNKLMVVTDALSGKVITTLPIGDGCDGVAFDPKLKRAYSSNYEGNMTVVQEVNANTYNVLETVPTLLGARTITIDKRSGHLYLTTAEIETVGTGSNPKRINKPNSFMILDIMPN